MSDYLFSVNAVCCGRDFFSATNGRVGLGPSGCQPRDSVCIFFSEITPFILRPAEGISGEHKVFWRKPCRRHHVRRGARNGGDKNLNGVYIGVASADDRLFRGTGIYEERFTDNYGFSWLLRISIYN